MKLKARRIIISPDIYDRGLEINEYLNGEQVGSISSLSMDEAIELALDLIVTATNFSERKIKEAEDEYE